MKLLPIAAVILELAGIVIIGIGIGIELVAKAHVGVLLITIGSVTVAAGGVMYGKFMRRK